MKVEFVFLVPAVIVLVAVSFFIGFNSNAPIDTCEVNFYGNVDLNIAVLGNLEEIGVSENIKITGMGVKAPCDSSFFERLGVA